MDRYDVIVVGLGAVGAATTRALAVAGARVLGVEQFTPPHVFGSSHGDTRITRLAVGEGPFYGELVARSHALWRELENEGSARLLEECGGLIMGISGSGEHHGVGDFVTATVAAARVRGVPHEVLDAGEIRARFSHFAVPEGTVGYYEPSAGYLRAEACVAAQLASAERHGATLLRNERVTGWRATPDVAVRTERDSYSAGSIVLAGGPWMSELVPLFAPAFAVHRQVLYWFAVTGNYDGWARSPVYIWLHGPTAGQFLYGFPAVNGPSGGVKVATETFLDSTDPARVNRTVTEAEQNSMFVDHVRDQLPTLGPDVVRATTCLYTVTPDFHFLVDRHPGIDAVVVASACSGHGFKHSPAVGEVAAALALGTVPPVDPGPFGFARFAPGSSAPAP